MDSSPASRRLLVGGRLTVGLGVCGRMGGWGGGCGGGEEAGRFGFRAPNIINQEARMSTGTVAL